MTRADSPSPDVDLRKLIPICDRLADSWKRGQAIRIEDLLAESADIPRGPLLQELLIVEVESRRARGEVPEPSTYRERFPDDAIAIETAFREADTARGTHPAAQTGDNPATDRSLLFSALAFHHRFIDRNQLLVALRAWRLDKSRPMDRILIEQAAIDKAQGALIHALLTEHINRHGENTEHSVTALSSLAPIRAELERLDDPEISAFLSAGNTLSADSELDARSPPSSRTGGRYRILRLHAEGGLGRVYEAKDEELGRVVAVKEIQPSHAGSPELRSRFLLEAEINGGLQHPGIVPVYSLGTYDDGQPFYSMRFVEGASLKDAVARYHEKHPRPDPTTKDFRDLLNRFVDVCNAIAFAHSRGVLHRDLKPHNVMIGNYGEALIIDWGLAKATGRSEPTAGEGEAASTLVPPSGSGVEPTQGIIGTPNYMSPEQAAGHVDQLGPPTDVYGLGAILYQMLTSRAPFQGRDQNEILPRVIRGEITPPRSVNPNIPTALESVCLKALALRPEDRYPAARALADDVERWLADAPVSAYSEPILVRMQRWMRRHQNLVTGTAALSFGLFLAALGLVWGMNQRAARRLETQRAVQVRLIDAHVGSAKLALQRGQWNDALSELDAARAEGRQEDVQAHLDRVKALDGLNLTSKAGDELTELMTLLREGRLTATASEVGLAQLREAELLTGRGTKEQARTLELIRNLANAPLPDAERAYANGLVSTDAEQTAGWFSKALELDPYHHRARLSLAVTYMLSGRAKDARLELGLAEQMFPDDLNVRVLRVVHHGLTGEFATAHAVLDKAGPRLSPSVVKTFHAVLNTLEIAVDAPGGPVGGDQTKFQQSVISLIPSILALDADMDVRMFAAMSTPPEFLRLYIQNMGRVLLYYSPPLLRILLGRLLGAAPPNEKEIEQVFKQTVKANPEGAILTIYGAWLWGKQRYAEAETTLLEAVSRPMAFGTSSINVLAHELLVSTQGALFLKLGIKADNLDPMNGPDGKPLDKVKVEALKKRAREHLLLYLKLGPPRAMVIDQVVPLAWIVGERDLAYYLAREGIKQWPDSGNLKGHINFMETSLGLRSPKKP